MKKAATLAILCLSLSACEYGLGEFFSRSDDVNIRSAYLTDISAPVPTPISNTYTVLVLTDIHFMYVGQHQDGVGVADGGWYLLMFTSSDRLKNSPKPYSQALRDRHSMARVAAFFMVMLLKMCSPGLRVWRCV